MVREYYFWNNRRQQFVKGKKPNNKPLSVTIRLATNNDREAIVSFSEDCAETEPEVYELPSNFAEIQERVRQTDFERNPEFAVILALLGKKLVGMLSISWYFNDDTCERVGVIPGVWVLKPFRMAGIGHRLMEEAKKEFLARGIRRVELMVGLDNLAARAFYEKMGFKIHPMGRAVIHLQVNR